MNIDDFIDEALKIIPKFEDDLRTSLYDIRSTGPGSMETVAHLLNQWVPDPARATGWKKKLWKLWHEEYNKV